MSYFCDNCNKAYKRCDVRSRVNITYSEKEGKPDGATVKVEEYEEENTERTCIKCEFDVINEG